MHKTSQSRISKHTWVRDERWKGSYVYLEINILYPVIFDDRVMTGWIRMDAYGPGRRLLATVAARGATQDAHTTAMAV